MVAVVVVVGFVVAGHPHRLEHAPETGRPNTSVVHAPAVNWRQSGGSGCPRQRVWVAVVVVAVAVVVVLVVAGHPHKFGHAAETGIPCRSTSVQAH